MTEDSLKTKKPRIAVYPGTFDPMTRGHLDIVTRAEALCDHLVIGVASNEDKHPLFSLEERLEIVQEEIETLNLKTQVWVKPFTGLLVNFAYDEKADFVVRGLRAVSDFEYEFQMAGMNARLSPSVETVFLIASDRCQFISSTLIKEITELGGDVSQFVSKNLERRLKNKLRHLP